MRKIATYSLASLLLATSIGFTSCDSVKNSNNTQRGAAIGAAGGAIIGGILGNNLGKGGNGALGAVLGGVIGGAAGGVIGNNMDRQARKIEETVPGAQVERVGEGIKLILGENSVNFALNQATLTDKAKTNLDKLIIVFKDEPDTYIDIYGYTDNTGREEYNLSLSKKRAASVKQYLVQKGIAASRVKTDGLGIADPIASNDTESGRAQNRRVEFGIRANEKMIQDAQNQSGTY
ncbi:MULTISPECIES: OmpA family protein [Myroides]|uniref:OmpA family protein n=1 Tax=Myroides albus TaxID=2562892 RepID=A0A6I3LNC4_9FLAO|nr:MULTISPECIES: OmpA family protein [Myroides]MTG99217.1 OmpA family protein [Myroides albus]MVX36193.1 OmpA family protein [Myroides sp. LoEW2-1]UVD78675.1 OmpA family protein [Myroides albus]